MRRRDLIAALGSASSLAVRASAQDRAGALRIGWASVLPKTSPVMSAFGNRMGELGYEEGKDFTLEYL